MPGRGRLGDFLGVGQPPGRLGAAGPNVDQFADAVCHWGPLWVSSRSRVIVALMAPWSSRTA